MKQRAGSADVPGPVSTNGDWRTPSSRGQRQHTNGERTISPLAMLSSFAFVFRPAHQRDAVVHQRPPPRLARLQAADGVEQAPIAARLVVAVTINPERTIELAHETKRSAAVGQFPFGLPAAARARRRWWRSLGRNVLDLTNG